MTMAVPFTPLRKPVRPATLPISERLLIALSEPERDVFFKDISIERALPTALPRQYAKSSNLAEWKKKLEEFRPTVVMSCWSTLSLPETFVSAPDSPLRYVCHVTGSVRDLIPRSFLERGGIVTNWGAIAAPQVAEHALLLALAGLRNLGQWQYFVQEKRAQSVWHPIPDLNTKSLFGRRVGLHGFGKIARALVELLKPFGVKLYGYSEGVPAELMRTADVTPCDNLLSLFSHSEVLFECEALTPHSTKSVTASALAALPNGAVFVNIGRGKVVDEAALYREAKTGRIRIALDVVAQDPLSTNTPAWSLAGAILSPHIAGPTLDQFPQCGKNAIENLNRYLNKEPLESIISLEIYDRST